MKHIEFRIISLAAWLVLLFSLERLLGPLHLSWLSRLLVLIGAVVPLAVPHLGRFGTGLLVGVSIASLIGYQVWNGALASGAQAVLTLVESGAVALTVWIARWTGSAVGEFETAVEHITIGRADRVPEPADLGAGSLYREVRRARNHQRPLTLMAVAVEDESLRGSVHRIVLEAQRAMMKQYALSGVSRMLCDKLADCDIVVQERDHFLVALPETTPENLPGLIDRLRREVSQEVGVDLKIGAACLPEDSYTLEGLVEKATLQMEADLDVQPMIQLPSNFVKSHAQKPSSG